MLHHANVDRLIAMWQAIRYTSSPIDTPYTTRGQYATARGLLIDADAPLKPFYNENGEFWTTNTGRYPSAFGYDYEDIPHWKFKDDLEGLRQHVTGVVASLYGPQVSDAVEEASKESPATPPQIRSYRGRGTAVNSHQDRASHRLQGQQYFINIRVNKQDLPLPCIFKVFLGEKLAGTTAFLDMPNHGPTYAVLPLRSTLLEANAEGSFNSLDSNPELEYIKKSFRLELIRVRCFHSLLNFDIVPIMLTCFN